MKFSVRPADLDVDREVLIDLMLRYLTPMSDGPRYDWLYRQNPDGPAQLWVLTDVHKGTIVGSGGIVPRRMHVRGQEKLGAILVDFWIHPEYRSLGPALQLQRACLAGIDAGPYSLYYDFPERSMVAVYRRLAVQSTQSLVRMTKLLSMEKKLGKMGQVPLLGRTLIAGANSIIKLLDLRKGNRSAWTIREQKEDCGEDFTELAQRVCTGYGICVARTAPYLNWRFRSHFRNRYEMLTAHLDGTLMGYILFLDSGETATIVDLFGVDNPKMKSELVFAALKTLRKRGVFSVNSPNLSSHGHAKLLETLRFFPRETHPVIISTPRSAPGESVSMEGQNVFLMDGDRDS
jgi:GNAT superfamily N-acetyltransferase